MTKAKQATFTTSSQKIQDTNSTELNLVNTTSIFVSEKTTTKTSSVTTTKTTTSSTKSEIKEENLITDYIKQSTTAQTTITQTETSTTTTRKTTVTKTSSPKANECQNTSIYEPRVLTHSTSLYFRYPIAQTVGCYGSKLELRCPIGQHIRIHSAYYGNQLSPNYCNPTMDSVCFRSLSSDFVISTCENKTRCELLVTERLLGVPCPAEVASNQLLVQYQCLDEFVFEEINDTCHDVDNTRLESICPSIEHTNVIRLIC